MDPYEIIGPVVLVAAGVGWYLWCRVAAKKENLIARRRVGAARKEVKKWNDLLTQSERVLRMANIHNLINAKKCRACGEQKDVDEFDEVETKEGKSVALCLDCRKLMGLDNSEEQEAPKDSEASKDPNDSDDIASSFISEP